MNKIQYVVVSKLYKSNLDHNISYKWKYQVTGQRILSHDDLKLCPLTKWHLISPHSRSGYGYFIKTKVYRSRYREICFYTAYILSAKQIAEYEYRMTHSDLRLYNRLDVYKQKKYDECLIKLYGSKNHGLQYDKVSGLITSIDIPIIKQIENGYEQIYYDGIKIASHRLLFHILGIDIEGYDIHHIDMDRSNNRFNNLQILTREQHSQLHMNMRTLKNRFNHKTKH